MYISIFWAFCEYLLVKIEFLCAVVFVKTIEKGDVILVCVRISECEFDFMSLIFEKKIENAF